LRSEAAVLPSTTTEEGTLGVKINTPQETVELLRELRERKGAPVFVERPPLTDHPLEQSPEWDDAPPEPEEPKELPLMLPEPPTPPATPVPPSGPALEPICVRAVDHWRLAVGETCAHCGGVA
jgi:hypothetical protein